MFRLKAAILVAAAVLIRLRDDAIDRINAYIKKTALKLGIHAAGGKLLTVFQFEDLLVLRTGLSF